MPLLDPFEIVLFGGTGDLAMRKLIPALYQRFAAGQIDARTRILAAASSAMTRAEYLGRALEQAREHLAPTEFSEQRWERVCRLPGLSESGRDPRRGLQGAQGENRRP